MTSGMTVPAVVAAAVLSGTACGQSLFVRQPTLMINEQGQPDPLVELRSTSLFFVQPPEPREIRVHDLVYVIVDEVSRATSSQRLDTIKEFGIEADLNSALDLRSLIELELAAAGIDNLSLIDAEAENEFRSRGDFDRSDRITARLAATVLDVKPNGNLVLEARKTIGTDEERRTLLISGVCRQDDITLSNTILSSQLADLRFEMVYEGQVKKAASKGVITKALEFLFNF